MWRRTLFQRIKSMPFQIGKDAVQQYTSVGIQLQTTVLILLLLLPAVTRLRRTAGKIHLCAVNWSPKSLAFCINMPASFSNISIYSRTSWMNGSRHLLPVSTLYVLRLCSRSEIKQHYIACFCCGSIVYYWAVQGLEPWTNRADWIRNTRQKPKHGRIVKVGLRILYIIT